MGITGKDTTYGSKAILRLALPAIVSNLTVPLLGLSDTAISGHLGNSIYLAAMAVGAMMFNLVFWLFACLRMSTTGLTANAYGAGNDYESRHILAQSFVLSLLIGIAIIMFRTPLKLLLLAIISPDAEVADMASDYFMTTSLCAPAVLAQMTLCGWFVGMQNTFYPMMMSIFTSLLNIAVSLILVVFVGMGFKGVAFGTFYANWGGLLLGVYFLYRFGGSTLFEEFLRGNLLRGAGRFFKINGDLFLRSACIMAVTMAMTSYGARLGAMTLAVNVVMMQFFHLFSYFSDGFAFAAEAISGKLAGSGRMDDLRKGVRNLLAWGGAMALLFTAVYGCGSGLITDLITSDASVRAGVRAMRIWLILLPGLTVSAFIFDGIFIGLTSTRLMLLAAFLSALLFFIISFPYSGFPADNARLWSAFISYLVCRGLVLALFSPRILTSKTA